MRAFVPPLIVLAATTPALSQDRPLAARIRAVLEATGDAKTAALTELEKTPVPPDAGARSRVLREALAFPPREKAARIEEKLGETQTFFVTPKAFDAKKAWPTVLSLHGRHGNGHHGLQPFALPEAEWRELRKPIEEDLAKKGYEPSKVTIRRPDPKIPWEDGLVLAPTIPSDADPPIDQVVATCLAAVARANRSFAADPDRVVISGISLGGWQAWQVACRHPDRFAGLVPVGTAAPAEKVENLKALAVYIVHGAKDETIKVERAREMAKLLAEAKVPHVYREIATLGHAWPEKDEGAKVRAWMRERVRTPWPREVSHTFLAAARLYWLEVPRGPTRVTARVRENEIDLEVAEGTASVTLHLGEPLVALEKDVVVRWGSREVFRGRLERRWTTLVEDLEGDGFDVVRAAPARLTVKAP